MCSHEWKIQESKNIYTHTYTYSGIRETNSGILIIYSNLNVFLRQQHVYVVPNYVCISEFMNILYIFFFICGFLVPSSFDADSYELVHWIWHIPNNKVTSTVVVPELPLGTVQIHKISKNPKILLENILYTYLCRYLPPYSGRVCEILLQYL
jgi:predicted transporter